MTKDFSLNNHVSWLFLPAGIRIILILVFTYTGAIGLSIASLMIGFISNAPYDLITAAGIALICGFAPLLSRLFVIHHFQVHPNLNNLTTRQLIWIILIFALFNSFINCGLLHVALIPEDGIILLPCSLETLLDL